jgi:tetratricopeptide (TPR) repeat protein
MAAVGATLKDVLHPLPWYAVSQVELIRGNLDAAESAAGVALSCNPMSPGLLSHRAAVVLARGRAEEAVEVAGRALEIAPDYVDAHLVRGRALWRLGRHDEAEAAYLRALAADPESADAHTLAGGAALRRGDAAAALRHYHEALRMDPAITTAQEGMMEALRARNRFYRAVLRVSLRLPPDFPSRLKWAAICIGVWLVCMVWLAADDMGVPWPLTLAVQAAIVAAVVLTWTSRPLGDLLLSLDPLGARALSTGQRVVAFAVGGLLALAVGLTVAVVAGASGDLGFAAALAALYTIPVTAAARAGPGWRWKLATAYTLALLAPVCAFIVLQARGSDAASTWFGLSVGGMAMSDLLEEFIHDR